MQEVPSASDVAIVYGEFGMFDPQTLFDHLTSPDLLVKWWPETAVADLRVGGSYELEWPGMG